LLRLAIAALVCGMVGLGGRAAVAGAPTQRWTHAERVRVDRRIDWATLAPALLAQAPGLKPAVLRLALRAVRHVRAEGLAPRPTLAVIDYGLPSTRRRMWVFDLVRRRLLLHLRVAHGRGSGELTPTRFSNREHSLQTSLGLYLATATYEGRHGYSLALRGLDPGFNDQAARRRIVVHGAWYVSEDFIEAHGELGRSWGCPAVDDDVSRLLIDDLKHGGLLFAYAPDPRWLEGSRLLNGRPRACVRSARALSRASRPGPAGR
jgi:hypothetical protein